MEIRPIIFGSGGFIGQYLCKQYPKGFFADKKNSPALDVLNIDFNYAKNKINKATVLIHLAADPDMASCEENIIQTMKNNYCSTIIAVEVANMLDIPLVFTSTSMVYTQSRRHDELFIVPNGPAYTKSKLMAEKYILDNCVVPFSIIRLANCVGGSSKHGVIWDLCRKSKKHGKIRVRGDGNQRRSYVHVSDFVNFCDLVIKKLLNDKFHYNDISIINFGNGDTVPVRDIIKEIVKGTGKKYFFDKIPRVFDPSKVSMQYTNLKLNFPNFKYMNSSKAVKRAIKETKMVIENERGI